MTVVFVSKTDAFEFIEVELLTEPVPDPTEAGRVFNTRYRPYNPYAVTEVAEEPAPEPEPEPEPEPVPFLQRKRKKKGQTVEPEPEPLVEPEPEPEDEWTYTTLGHLRRDYRPLDGRNMKELISPSEEGAA